MDGYIHGLSSMEPSRYRVERQTRCTHILLLLLFLRGGGFISGRLFIGETGAPPLLWQSLGPPAAWRHRRLALFGKHFTGIGRRKLVRLVYISRGIGYEKHVQVHASGL
jgi:hypothetical protein